MICYIWRHSLDVYCHMTLNFKFKLLHYFYLCSWFVYFELLTWNIEKKKCLCHNEFVMLHVFFLFQAHIMSINFSPIYVINKQLYSLIKTKFIKSCCFFLFIFLMIILRVWVNKLLSFSTEQQRLLLIWFNINVKYHCLIGYVVVIDRTNKHWIKAIRFKGRGD